MKHSDFHIGLRFKCGNKVWSCTDVGTRVIIAIHLDPCKNSSWFHGPPFAVAESIFDEYDMGGCEPIDKE